MSLSPDRFQKLVLAWFKQHGRKDFPWQKNKTPYRVWLSEIMLQQTQVTTVIPYFERFLSVFPDLASLAAAEEDEVLHLWSGLGYYSRARNLHRSAKMIQETFKGQFPSTVEELQQLPGIGRSTAGAILTSAFNKKAAILDGNVKRLLSRFHALRAPIDDPKTQEQLWQLAEAYTPSRQVADYTQVMMDLGATVCIRKKPKCDACPLSSHCQAHEQGVADELPLKKNRRRLPVRTVSFLILRQEDQILLQKRPPSGIWGGLWGLFELPQKATKQQIHSFCFDQFQVYPEKIENLVPFRHSFTHFHLNIFPFQLSVGKSSCKNIDSRTQLWYSLRKPKAIGLPAPVQILLEKVTHDSRD